MAGYSSGWQQLTRLRVRHLLRPYAWGLSSYLGGYWLLTALLRPWGLGAWWSVAVPLAAGLALCGWLWRPWGLLARNEKGETRFTPLLLTWVLSVSLGWSSRQLLHARLGEVRDVHSVRELAQPGSAVFFRLHGPFYIAKPQHGRHAAIDHTTARGGTKTYYANAYYACPLLAAPGDTAHARPPVTWLGYSYREDLGQDLAPGEQQWRNTQAEIRLDARFDSLAVTRFAYLEREEEPAAGLYQAVCASPLWAQVAQEAPLLLTPVEHPFAERGRRWLKLTLGLLFIGNPFIISLLLFMKLRPAAEWPD